MKQATIKKKTSPIETKKVPAGEKPVRMCERVGCSRAVTGRRKRFCSHTCRNLWLTHAAGNGGGTVEKYKPEYSTTKMREYLDMCEEKSQTEMIPTRDSYIIERKAKIPTVDGYARFIGVFERTPDNWAKVHPEFARALDSLLSIQKEWILNEGIAGHYSPVITKLILSANHGMIERKQVTNEHKFFGIVKHLFARADEIEKQKYGGNS